MRIIFIGGKDVGCACLEWLMEEDFEIAAVIVNPNDTEAGRYFRSATELSRPRGIPTFCPEDINSPESVEQIRSLNPDTIVVVYYDQILKRDLIAVPASGCINLHLALAEEYRGCYPTTWAIINGEERTGVTLHYIDEGIDSGDIIAQKIVPIEKSDTGFDLYRKCTEAGIELFKETFPLIAQGKASRTPQKTTSKTRYYPRKSFPSHEVDLNKSGKELCDYIRALTFPPFPAPCFRIGNRKMVIVEERQEEPETADE